jgi:hypothetical protein
MVIASMSHNQEGTIMLLQDIVQDGRKFKKNAKFVNKRAKVHETVITVLSNSDTRNEVKYLITREGQMSRPNDRKTVTVEVFAKLVSDTFGGWYDDAQKLKQQKVVDAQKAEKQAILNAAHAEALEFESKLDSIMFGHDVLTRQDLYMLTVGAVNAAYSAGFDKGYESAEDNAYLDRVFGG